MTTSPLYLRQLEIGPMQNYVYLVGDPEIGFVPQLAIEAPHKISDRHPMIFASIRPASQIRWTCLGLQYPSSKCRATANDLC